MRNENQEINFNYSTVGQHYIQQPSVWKLGCEHLVERCTRCGGIPSGEYTKCLQIIENTLMAIFILNIFWTKQ